MRGRKQAQRQFLAVVDVNARIPSGHPIREIKRLSDGVFGRLSPRFEAIVQRDGPALHAAGTFAGRAAPDGPLQRTARSGPSRERLRYDLLFQGFLDLELDEEPFGCQHLQQNQQRLLEHQAADEFFACVSY